MKTIKIVGAGGSGKSYYLANLIKQREEQEYGFNFLVLSYTHIGKNAIIEEYNRLKGINENLRNINTSYAKTFHTFIFELAHSLIRGKDKESYKGLMAFLKKEEKKQTLELFEKLPEKQEFWKDLNLLKELCKDLDLDYNTLKKILVELTGGESLFKQEKKVDLSRYRDKEVITALYLIEGNALDSGFLVDPFKGARIDKNLYILMKYDLLYNKKIDYDLFIELKDQLINLKYPVNHHVILYKLLEKLSFFRKELQEKFNYSVIILDEAQDLPTNLVEFITNLKISKELIQAGDPYQAIFMDLGYNSVFNNVKDEKELFSKIKYMDKIKRYPEVYKEWLVDYFDNFNLEVKTLTNAEADKEYYRNKEFLIKVVDGRNVNYEILAKNNFVLVSNVSILSALRKTLKREDLLIYYIKEVVKTNEILNLISFLDALKKHYPALFRELLDYYWEDDLEKHLIKQVFRRIIKDVYEEDKKKYYQAHYIVENKLHNLNEKLKKKNFSYLLSDIFQELIPIFTNSKQISENVNKIIHEYLKVYYAVLKELDERKKITNKLIGIKHINTYRAKGKTLDRVAYLPIHGKYMNLIKRNKNFYFIKFMMDYVALTRPRKAMVYLKI